ncbi:MAG: Aldehyde Dehydrogenase [Frankiales bacterium]|nr:Aldehyde Dehydrogenase [Frankiales bacterium]
MTDVREFWVAGQLETAEETFEVRAPYDGSHLATVAVTSPEQTERAVAAAVAVGPALAGLPAHRRSAALAHVSRRIAERADEFAQLISNENGKPLKWALAEVGRATSTFQWAAEEARRWSGALQRLDTDPNGEGRMAVVRRFPRGPVLGISPFNFPLNLVAHKVAPALAVGAPIVLKPAPKTPLSALLLGELLAETDLPAGAWSVITVPDARMPELVADPRLPVVSFTGSGPVGWRIRESVPTKHVTLELGGNGAVLVAADWSSPEDLRYAAERIARFSNYQAGQSCVAVQRVYADAGVHDELLAEIVKAVEALRTGDPRDAATDVGPLIDLASAERVEAWVDEAMAKGAVLRTGGQREGTTYAPTVLTGVPADATLAREEVFGPVLFVESVADLTEGLARVNDSQYGLQAGVFTHDMTTAFRAHRELEVGGVIIGDVPTFRADQMPYGGAKASGVGREGLHAAMEDMTVERVLVLSGLDL